MNIKATIIYDGTNYFGFQKTKIGTSIEEALEKALFQILRKKTYLQVASRTDKGVHAKGQVFNFFIEQKESLEKLQDRLNAVLPTDIRILSLEKEKASFHSSLDSKQKTYSYHIYHGKFLAPHIRTTYWHYPYKPLNISHMLAAAEMFTGKHDFSAFSSKEYNDGTCFIQKIKIKELSKERLEIRITGDRFLYKMVRILVGTLVSIAVGNSKLSDAKMILLHKARIKAGVTAPALGLCLEKIEFF